MVYLTVKILGGIRPSAEAPVLDSTSVRSDMSTFNFMLKCRVASKEVNNSYEKNDFLPQILICQRQLYFPSRMSRKLTWTVIQLHSKSRRFLILINTFLRRRRKKAWDGKESMNIIYFHFTVKSIERDCSQLMTF